MRSALVAAIFCLIAPSAHATDLEVIAVKELA